MALTLPAEDVELKHDRLLLIVVGAHLRAEVGDRALGYRLRERLLQWEADHPDNSTHATKVKALQPIVCTDLWYLNQPDLMTRPTIALGAPGVNAATAYFANRLPVACMIDGSLQVQMDLQSNCPAACLWGIDRAATSSAVELFVERYLEEFLDAVHT